MHKIAGFILFMFVSLCVFGEGADFDKLARNYLSDLERAVAPVFYTTCKTKDGHAVMVFGVTKKTGMLFELNGKEVVNSASVLLKDNAISLDVGETQGGIYTYTAMTNRAKDLSRLPFRLSLPKDIKNILQVKPDSKCVDKPPTQ